MYTLCIDSIYCWYTFGMFFGICFVIFWVSNTFNDIFEPWLMTLHKLHRPGLMTFSNHAAFSTLAPGAAMHLREGCTQLSSGGSIRCVAGPANFLRATLAPIGAAAKRIVWLPWASDAVGGMEYMLVHSTCQSFECCLKMTNLRFIILCMRSINSCLAFHKITARMYTSLCLYILFSGSPGAGSVSIILYICVPSKCIKPGLHSSGGVASVSSQVASYAIEVYQAWSQVYQAMHLVHQTIGLGKSLARVLLVIQTSHLTRSKY